MRRTAPGAALAEDAELVTYTGGVYSPPGRHAYYLAMDAGDIVFAFQSGYSLTYPASAKERIEFSGVDVTEAGTTVTVLVSMMDYQ